MAVMEAQQWCEKMENREETAAICAKRQWINVPVEDVTDRMKGKFDYGTGRVVENSAAADALLEGPGLLPVPEPRSLVHHRGHPLGQV
jgi:ABC-type nitrate/sulfonate/bicarbonate transport system substrate-binding protein